MIALSPQITGAGFLTRGAQVSQVSVPGVEPGLGSAILNLAGSTVAGPERLRAIVIFLGCDLTDDLDLSVGQILRLQSAQGMTALLTPGGIYQTGNGGGDGSTAFVSLYTARTLFGLPQGATRNEIKLTDLNTAAACASGRGRDFPPYLGPTVPRS